MAFIRLSLLCVCVALASAKSAQPGAVRKFNRDQVAQESSASYVALPPNDATQEHNKSERTFNLLKGSSSTSGSTYPAASSSSYASASSNTYPTASNANNAGGRFFGVTSLANSGVANKLQLGLSFIVPFLNLPLGGNGIGGYSSSSGVGSTGSSYYGTGTSGASNGISSLLALNPKSIIKVIAVALGALLLIPLFLSLLTGINTSSLGRSEDVQDTFNFVMARVDDALQSYNIDASNCMSRAICTYVRSATKKVADGSAGSTEKIIDGLSSNGYLSSMVDGTSISKAIEMGRKPGTTCVAAFPKCPFNVNTMTRYLASYISQTVEAPLEKPDKSDHKPENPQKPQS